MSEEIPHIIEIVFCVDAGGNGRIVSGAKQWDDGVIIDGCDFDDNGIVLPKGIDHGVYKGTLTLNTWRDHEGEYDLDIKLSDIQEFLSQTQLNQLDNAKQKIATLEKRIAELEPESGFISIEGNDSFNCEALEISKIDDHTIHLKVGHSCVYYADLNIPCEVFTGFIGNLIDGSGKHLIEILEDNMPWQEKGVSAALFNLKKANP